MKRLTALLITVVVLAGLVAACGPAPTPEVVEKVVKETVVVEKEIEVEITKVVEVVKEVVVTPTPKPELTEAPLPAQVEDDFYFSNGEKIPVTIALDQIGIVANEGVAAEQIEAFASELGLEPIREVSESMFILGLSQPLDRGSLIQFAREVKSQGEQLLREAGLVVATEGDPTPMLLTDEFIALFSPEVPQEEIAEFIRSHDVEIMRPAGPFENQFFLKVKAPRIDALKMANLFHESPLTASSHPNFWWMWMFAGCFTFSDGTTQNWTLDQLYDTYSKPPTKVTTYVPPNQIPLTPFYLTNHQNIALEASAGFYAVADKGVKSCDIYFESPDLSKDAKWQNIAGYSVDVRREFTGHRGDPPKSFFAQLQLVVVDTSDNSEHLWAETIGTTKTFKFHDIKLRTPYHFVWKPSDLSDPKYKIKQIRIRLTMPGWTPTEAVDLPFSGSWKIGNVCPEK